MDTQAAALKCKVPHSSGDSIAGSLPIPAAHGRTDDQQVQASAQGPDDCLAPQGLPISGRRTFGALVSAPQTGSCTTMAHSIAPREGAMPQSSAGKWRPPPSEQQVRAEQYGVEQNDVPPEAESASGYSAPRVQAVTGAPSRRSSLRESLQGSLRSSLGRNVANPQLEEVLLDPEVEEEVQQVRYTCCSQPVAFTLLLSHRAKVLELSSTMAAAWQRQLHAHMSACTTIIMLQVMELIHSISIRKRHKWQGPAHCLPSLPRAQNDIRGVSVRTVGVPGALGTLRGHQTGSGRSR